MNKNKLLNNLKKLNETKITIPKRDKKNKEDFNFFQPYIGKQNKEKNQFLYVTVVATSLVVIFTSSFVLNLMQINNRQEEIENLKKQVESPQIKVKLNEVDKFKKKYDVLNKYYGQAYIITTAIDNKSVINSALIGKVFLQIPKTLSFKSFNVTVGDKGVGGNIDIQGVAETRANIAELEYNLKLVDSIKEVHVSNITEVNNILESKLNVNLTNNSSYTFSIKCILKDVDENEAK